MQDFTNLPRYDRHQTYLWNYEHAPEPVEPGRHLRFIQPQISFFHDVSRNLIIGLFLALS